MIVNRTLIFSVLFMLTTKINPELIICNATIVDAKETKIEKVEDLPSPNIILQDKLPQSSTEQSLSSVFQCKSARNCTSDAEKGQSRDHCQPKTIKKHSIPAIINIILIIVIGGFGNLLTILSIVHARLR